MTPIVTGADVFRAKQILAAADIRALDATAVLLAPAMPGKSLMVISAFAKYSFATQAFNGSGTTGVFYGPVNTGVEAVAFNLAAVILSSASEIVNPAGTLGFSLHALTSVQGLGLYLVSTGAGSTTGSPTTAIPTPGHLGTGYAALDTGTISGAGDGTATYEVLTVATGAVSTVSVAGGKGYSVGTGITTTVVTGAGDGALELNITAIRETGDGKLELDLLYQPI